MPGKTPRHLRSYPISAYPVTKKLSPFLAHVTIPNLTLTFQEAQMNYVYSIICLPENREKEATLLTRIQQITGRLPSEVYLNSDSFYSSTHIDLFELLWPNQKNNHIIHVFSLISKYQLKQSITDSLLATAQFFGLVIKPLTGYGADDKGCPNHFWFAVLEIRDLGHEELLDRLYISTYQGTQAQIQALPQGRAVVSLQNTQCISESTIVFLEFFLSKQENIKFLDSHHS